VDVQAAAEQVIRGMPAQVSGGTAWLDTVLDGQVFFRGTEWSEAYFADQLTQRPRVRLRDRCQAAPGGLGRSVR
jgi:hypothetical protein